ncbi:MULTISPECIES: serine protease [unclassified Sphingobacterium]|uniref:S1 family peptidase n=1 Tax=unclassified Sphingobacterium TaxID=2609468 RepID=UPI0010F32730|nr:MULTISPECIES: serine protease [unclassified Sphingobacterium]MCS3556139.1 S1-C subfamily serine protease [Sphingobacterium sp. JUb21]TCR08515.1 trypsin-like peptidase [Sphingobacterium sp. JUb20]
MICKFYLMLGLFICFAGTAKSQDEKMELNHYKDKLLTQKSLSDDLDSVASHHPEWGRTAFQAKQVTGKAKSKIDIKIPDAHKRKLSGEDMYAKAKDGVLMVGRYYNCGHCNNMHADVMATAAVLTSDGICVTNYHVIENFLPSDNARSKLDSIYFLGGYDGSAYPITEILSYDKVGDVAIVKVDPRGRKLTAIPLGKAQYPGAHVRAITHPKGYVYYYSEGVVSNNTINAKEPSTRRMQITADYAQGSSGGPIFDEAGNLVGLVSTTHSLLADTSHQMTVKNTIPVEIIRDLFK